jgi:4-diphosphocytidyl-2-C-methyl-D-erythritol kinase
MTAEAAAREVARAKVNLFLHVRGRRPDGRHTLESLAVFPETGDVLTAEPSATRSLSLAGPFSIGLGAGEDNLALRAVEALGAALGEPCGLALHLDKRLPVASGIGGGSADAAAALRLALRVWGRETPRDALARVALSLGADVPVCLASAPALMGGVGETLAPAPSMPEFWMVLVNPLQPVSTAAVFAALERRDNPPGPRPPAGFADLGALVAWLSTTRNDLEEPARRLAPVIGAALGALRWTPACRLARMSGSGATCFGLFETEAAATEAAAALRAREPRWWATPARVAASGRSAPAV